jgi:cytoskeletal protein CcmA (bactofilin family)
MLKQSNTPETLEPTGQPSEKSEISRKIIVKGEITGAEALFVDGKVEGSINLPKNLVTVGENGQISADIMAREVVVRGNILGNVISDRVEVRTEGSLTGDVATQRIKVDEGAFFKGRIDIQKPDQPAEKTKSAAGANGSATH